LSLFTEIIGILIMADDKKKRSVSLVLGSGGARGLAHIGVLYWLEENNFEVQSISGCSAGALIGGVYAADKLPEFEQWVRAIKQIDVVSLLDISWQGVGLVKGDKIINTLVDLVGDQRIENLAIKFTAVAADIAGEKEVWLQSGSLFEAIRASISLPMLFTPVKYKGSFLIDGGVLNPVPIAPTFSDNTDLTLAVNLGGPATDVQLAATSAPVVSADANDTMLHSKISRFIGRLQESFSSAPAEEKEWGIYDVANQAFDAMQGTIARQKLAAYPPDVVIEISRNACGTFDFHRASQMIDLGYQAAEKQLAQIKY
jgi:NTE family protein